LAEAKQHITQFVKPGEMVNYIPPGQWAQVEWKEVTLDGRKGDPTALLDLRHNVLTELGNTIFKGTHIIYRGGKMTLIDVFFEDCTFDVADTPNGRSFITQVLNPSPYTRFASD
jgi:hypothetical protein